MHLVGYFILTDDFEEVLLLVFFIIGLLRQRILFEVKVVAVLVILKVIQEVLVFEGCSLLLHL